MFMSTACLWLLTLQDVHNSVLKVCSLAFFEQFTGMLRNMKDPGNGKQTGNEWKKCHRSTGTAGTGWPRRGLCLARAAQLQTALVFRLADVVRTSADVIYGITTAQLVTLHSGWTSIYRRSTSSAWPIRLDGALRVSASTAVFVHRFVEVVTLNDSTVEQPLNGTEKVWKRRHCLLQGQSRSKCLTTLVLEFFVRDVHETLQSDRAPPKAIAWDHTRQSIKLGVNQANTVVHIHKTRKTDEGNSTCGALFPAVTISFGIQLARSLSLSLSLSLCCFCGKCPLNIFEQCHMWRGYLAISLAITWR